MGCFSVLLHYTQLIRLLGVSMAFFSTLSALQRNNGQPVVAAVHHVQFCVLAMEQLEVPAGWCTQFAACTVHDSALHEAAQTAF